MTEIRVPGISRYLLSCVRDFPAGCGPNAVLVGRNPSPEVADVVTSKPVANGFETPERNPLISAISDAVAAVPLGVDSGLVVVAEGKAACDVVSDVGTRQMDSVGEGARMTIDDTPPRGVEKYSGSSQLAGVEATVLSDGLLPSGKGNDVVDMPVESERADSMSMELSFSGWKSAPAVMNDAGKGEDVCSRKDMEAAMVLDAVLPSVTSGKENDVVAISAVSEPADSMSVNVSFSTWKAAPEITNDVGKGEDGCSGKDVDMEMISERKGKEVVAVIAGSSKRQSDISKNRLEQVEVQEVVQRDLVCGTWNLDKECYLRKYPPPRAVSAIRDFPAGCGPNLPLQSGEECSRLAREPVLSKGKKLVASSSDEAHQKQAQAMDMPAGVPVDKVEERDKANKDSPFISKSSCKGVPMVDHQREQAVDLAQAIPDIPLDNVEKWNDEANRRENTTKTVSHKAPVQNLSLEKHHIQNTVNEFGSKTFVVKGKITARKSTNNLPENPVKKRKFNDDVQIEQATNIKDLDYPKLDGNRERFLVQALMAADKCPWRLTEKLGASSSRSPYVKAKRKEVTDAKKLALNEMEDEEPSIKIKRKQTSSTKKSFNRMKDEKTNVVVKRREKSEAKKLSFHITEGEEDSASQDAEAERSVVVKWPDEFTITLPPVTPALANGDGSNEEITPRQKVKRVLKQFNTLFRKLLHQVESKPNVSSGKMRIDLTVVEMLKQAGAFVNKDSESILGEVPGVEVGDEFGYRVELAVVGLHRPYQGGIDFAKRDGMHVALSVVASGGYEDDMENTDELTYTGSGGKPASGGNKAEDQKLERGNLALKNSISRRTPVRVIHGFKVAKAGLYGNGKPKTVSTFTYAGLYYVDNYWQEKGKDNYLEYKFKLVRIPGQPELALHQVKKSKKSEVREGQCVLDISQGKERPPICAINTEDDEQPQPFKYITKMKYPPSFARAPAKGCDCTGACKDSGNCACASKNGGEIPYNFNGAIVQAKRLVYECGPTCKCSKSCPNRVSQHGIKIPLEIFKTKTRGWGVRSLSSITSGTFICEYLGELVEDKEAEKRSNDEYFFDIGNNYEDNTLWEGIPNATPSPLSSPSEAETGTFTIDAAEYGNVGRFINHSCTPNLYAQNVLYDHDDKRMPHIMFFAAENIPPLQELTYHYNYAVDSVHDADGNIRRKDCYCGSTECTGRLY